MASKAHLHLIRYALKQGCVISVFDTRQWVVNQSDAFFKIKTAVERAGEAAIRIRNTRNGVVVMQAVVCSCLPPHETVTDWTWNNFQDTWWNLYKQEQGL